jgi:hypothetical protein
LVQWRSDAASVRPRPVTQREVPVLGTFCFRHNPVIARRAKPLERAATGRVAANFAKLLDLLKKTKCGGSPIVAPASRSAS